MSMDHTAHNDYLAEPIAKIMKNTDWPVKFSLSTLTSQIKTLRALVMLIKTSAL
ncbi:Uncharacterised protein [Weissella viridescens]|uniref:Uncharacterized protein n=1 Tax=Weissella viridescens TaxID=1629 RepID=A0A380P2Q9_WEIVI|nr:Uncharacterised protein [Weissella viridescens]